MRVAFQIQDDLLNLVGEEARYGKEIAGNIWEGKRTVMLINLIERCSQREKRRVVDLLSKPRTEKTADEVEYVFKLMKKHGCIRHGQQISRKFALKANALFERQPGWLPNSPHKAFLKELINYVVYTDV